MAARRADGEARTPAQRARHALAYVTPSAPQTGSRMRGQMQSVGVQQSLTAGQSVTGASASSTQPEPQQNWPRGQQSPGSSHVPEAATSTPAQAARQLLLYVLPSTPQTGARRRGHTHGGPLEMTDSPSCAAAGPAYRSTGDVWQAR